MWWVAVLFGWRRIIMWSVDLKILVADDNEDAAESLAMLFEIEGCMVRTENTGVAALRTFRAFRPAVCCLDIGMPGMTGYEVAKSIRLDQADASPLLIAISGWGTAKDKARARMSGFNHHLIKPPDFGTLTIMINTFLVHQSRR